MPRKDRTIAKLEKFDAVVFAVELIFDGQCKPFKTVDLDQKVVRAGKAPRKDRVCRINVGAKANSIGIAALINNSVRTKATFKAVKIVTRTAAQFVVACAA